MGLVKFGEYNPLGAQALKYSRDWFWADDSTSIPSDTRSEDWDCPFDDKDIEDSTIG